MSKPTKCVKENHSVPAGQHGSDKDPKKYEVYLEERKDLIQAKQEGARSFDKAALTLAAGAFGLSLTFIHNIAPNGIKAGTGSILGLAWFSFAVSMLVTLCSFLTSQRACSKQIRLLEVEYFENKKADKNRWAISTDVLNISSIVFFIVGVVCLGWFSYANLPRAEFN